MKKSSYLIIISIILLSCSSSGYNKLKQGTFELYLTDTLIAHVYRDENIQIEKYTDNGEILVAKIKWKNKKTLLMKDIGNNLKDIDTLTWLLSYEKTDKKNLFLGKGELAYIDTSNYIYYFD